MAKKVDPKAKEKRQKIIAAVGAVLLLGLLAFQLPRTMKMLNQKAPEQPVPVAAPTTTDPSALPTLGGAGAAGGGAAPTGGGGGGTLISSDTAPTPQAGQLVAFGRFESKDPFKQQIDPDALQSGGAPSSGSKSEGSSSSSGGGKSSPTGGKSSATGGGVVHQGGSKGSPTVAAGSALISVNGVQETVAVKATFPKDEPVFVLVSLKGGEARIAIAGGAFASGAGTIALKKGKAVTLQNTADGTRYELVLVAVG